MSRNLTAIVFEEDGGFVSLCPEVDVSSQGETADEARDNLREALELFFECASAAEVNHRQSGVAREKNSNRLDQQGW